MIRVSTIQAEQTHALRRAVLRADHPDAPVVWDADEREDSFHLGGFVQDALVGIATFQREACPEPGIRALAEGAEEEMYRLRGMAVAPEYQRQEIGSLMLAVGYDRLLRRGVPALWCQARTGAVAFYLRNGWALFGERFQVEDVGEHAWMAVAVREHACPCGCGGTKPQ